MSSVRTQAMQPAKSQQSSTLVFAHVTVLPGLEIIGVRFPRRRSRMHDRKL
jgi:hypothetical protein